ncbi:MAG: isoamylase early set domain-containing protein [Desulfobacula sp.]|nr:isoamylase early set domain-containing protein [Desulfobacula sp.]
MMFTKKYLKTKPVCKVNFKLLKKCIGPAKTVRLIGEFNDWDMNVTPMKKLKNGDFSYMLDLEKEKAYQFRYLIDGKKWVNDESADAYLPSPFPGVENSVIAL